MKVDLRRRPSTIGAGEVGLKASLGFTAEDKQTVVPKAARRVEIAYN